mgnify:CR=1 FL=1
MIPNKGKALTKERYLILKPENFGADAQLVGPQDLMLLKTMNKRSLYKILQNGPKISYYLNQLINRHEYRIVFCFTDRKRQMQITANLEKSIFPEVRAIVVGDSECFNDIKPNRPIIFKSNHHQTKIAGYSNMNGRTTSELDALSAMLSISEDERKYHIVIDTDLSFIETASKEGWRTYHIKRDLLLDTLIEILQPLKPSSQEFVLIKDEEVKHGSSPNRGWYIHKITGKKWFGKTSMDSIFPPKDKPSGYSLYKEYLAGIFYSVLGVATPATALSEQMLNESEAENYGVANSFTRLHLMSQFVDGFVELGPDFVKNYKNFEPKTSYFQVTEKRLPLRGLGRTLAIAILLHDYDCIGNSGANMGYVIKDDHAEIVKIDPGEALSFAKDMSGAKEFENHPKERKAILGTQQGKINFDELNKRDQEEFAQTIQLILKLPDVYIEEVVTRFASVSDSFETILDRLLDRKNNLLAAFSIEVREVLLKQIETDKANYCIKHWDDQTKLSSVSNLDEKKLTFIEDTSRLEAAKALTTSSSEETIKFQFPPPNKFFIGRREELQEMKNCFNASEDNLTYIALVGSQGLGKTQLAVEYITNNLNYSHIIWFHGEKTGLLLPQIQNYIRIFIDHQFHWMLVSNCKAKFDFSSRSYLLNRFYQSFNTNVNSISEPKKVCLVFDNAESIEEIVDYLPNHATSAPAKIDIIITSRYKEWEKLAKKVFVLKRFSDEETKRYISAQLHKSGSNEEIKKLNKLLNGLPIAISFAIASMKRDNQRLVDYCNKILEDNSKILEVEESEVFRRQLIIAAAELCEKNHLVKKIIDIIPYLAPEHITLPVLLNCYNLGKDYENEYKKALELLELHSIVSQRHEESEALNGKNEKAGIEVHRLTQQIIRSVHMRSPNAWKYTDILLYSLQTQLKLNEDDVSDMMRLKSSHHLIAHSIYLSDLDEFKDPDKILKTFGPVYGRKFSSLLKRIGIFQFDVVGDYLQAKKYFLRSLEVGERCYDGIKKYNLCVTLLNLMSACEFLGQHEDQKIFMMRLIERFKELLVLFKWFSSLFPQEARNIIKKFFATGPPNIIKLGLFHSAVRKIWREFGAHLIHKPLIIGVLEVFDEDYNEANEGNFRIWGCLGFLWGFIGELEIREECWSRALELGREVYGNEHLCVGQCLYTMSTLWRDLENYEKVRDYLNEAFEILLNKLGDSHPYVAMIAMELADVYGQLGDYHQKKQILIQALGIFKRGYSENHIHVGMVFKELAEVYAKLGNSKSRSETLKRALKIYESHYGKEHLETQAIKKSF